MWIPPSSAHDPGEAVRALASGAAMPALRIGTSGYSYAAWKGKFYPATLAAHDRLAYYAERFDAVEINASFYRMPTPELLAGWATQVPATFRFAFKAPRRITHDRRLQAPAETHRLAEVLRGLDARLGPVLFQLPASFKLDLARLDAFLGEWPSELPAAFEFRHRSWHVPEVYERLNVRDAALCLADVDEAEPPARVRTAGWGYLRLRRAEYEEAGLADWLERIREAGWREAYVFFKHEDEARGPVYATRFGELAAPWAAAVAGKS